MKTANLAANIETQLGADSEAQGATFMRGNTTVPAGSGSGLRWYEKLETAWGGGRKNIKTRAFRLGDLKRFLIKTGGNRQGICGLIGRD